MTADVTVVVAHRDGAATVGRALDSVEAQTLPPRAVVVVDDDSAPDQLAALEARARAGALPVRVLRLPRHQGPGAARNAGWAAARTRWVAFLDADDAWVPWKLAREAQVLVAHDPVLLGSRYLPCPDAPPEPVTGDLVVRRVALSRLLVHNPFPTPAVTVRRDVGPRFAATARAEDHAAWLSLVAEHGPALRLDEPLAYGFKAAYGESGLSGDMVAMARAEAAMFVAAGRTGVLSAGQVMVAEAFLGVRLARRFARAAARSVRRGR